jgi:hypothetical protein
MSEERTPASPEPGSGPGPELTKAFGMPFTMPLATVIAAVVIAIGLAFGGGGGGGGSGFGLGADTELGADSAKQSTNTSTSGRWVTVLGSAERIVAADLAIWSIRVVASGADLAQTQTKLDEEVDALTVFLVGEGIDQGAIDAGRPEVVDLLTLTERPEGVDETVRFMLSQAMTVRVGDVAAVNRAAARIGELAKLGVQVSGANAPVFQYTGLSKLKPELLAEAVEAARASALGLVTSVDGKVGAIRHAREGELVIEPRDGASFGDAEQAVEKRIRLSATVEFGLID